MSLDRCVSVAESADDILELQTSALGGDMRKSRFVWRTPIVTLGLLLLGGAGVRAQQPAGVGPQNRYIVQFQPGVDVDRGVQALAAQHGLGVEHVYRHALHGFSAVVPPPQLNALRSSAGVLSVEPDGIARAFAQTVPTGIARIGADTNAMAKIDGTDERVNVDVAILDTGIYPHADLNVAGAIDCTGGGPNGPKGGCKLLVASSDANGHGTHVAGTVGALDNNIGVVGVAPGVRLWSVRVLDGSGFGWWSWIIAGIDQVTAGANLAQGSLLGPIAVANMSLGGQGYNAAMRTAVKNSVAAGVVYVVAAGNESSDVNADGIFGNGDDYIPAVFPEVITVSALADSDGQAGGTGPGTSYGPDDTLATFSNFSGKAPQADWWGFVHPVIDIAAPGVNITSTYNNGGYASGWSGTSMSSPHVAGAVALYIAEHGPVSCALPQGCAAGVNAIRAGLSSTAQIIWRNGNPTLDPDDIHEGLIDVGGDVTPPPCTQATPGVTISPSSASGSAGTSKTYAVTVLNKDSGSCAVRTFALTPTVPDGWIPLLSKTSTAALSPGGSDSADLTIEIPQSAALATYLIAVVAEDATSSGEGTATFTVLAPLPPLTVTVSASGTFKLNSNVSIQAAVKRNGIGVPGATVAFTITGPVGASKTVTANASGVATWNYKIGPKDPTGSYTVTVVANSSGDTATGTDSFSVTK
jgi:subtilisin family serine protease